MRKYLLLIATAAIVASCAKTDSINEVNEVEIDFEKAYIDNVTKAIYKGPYTTDNFSRSGNTMGVFGWKNVTKDGNTSDDAIFTDEAVSHDGTNWSYSPKRYWDSNANHYKFFAYAPHSGDFTGTVAMATPVASAFSITGFTQSTTVAQQVDLLVDLESRKEDQTNKSTAATKPKVGFAFNHILSNVNFKMGVSTALKGDNQSNPVAVQSVEVKGVYINGTYSYANSAWGWSSRTSTSPFAATLKNNNTVVFASDELTATAADVPGLVNMLLIPGSVSGYTITINYTIGTEAFEKTINLTDFKNGNNAADASWAIATKYTYVLTIGPDPIEFDATSITDWGTGVTFTYEVK